MEKNFARIKCPVCSALVKIEAGAVNASCKFCGSAFELDGNGNVTGGAFVGRGIGPEVKGEGATGTAAGAAAGSEHAGTVHGQAELGQAEQMPDTVSYTSDELEDPEFKEQTKHMGVAFRNILAGAVGVLVTCLIVLGMLTLMTGLAGR